MHPLRGLALVLLVAYPTWASPLTLASTAFADRKPIPKQFTCDGDNGSPPLQWTGVPDATRAFVLVVDASGSPNRPWVHWVLYGVAPDARDLQASLPRSAKLPNGAMQGLNDFRKIGYGGPCPPPGKPHRYSFRLYALDQPIGLRPGATAADVQQAITHHVLAHSELIGTYRR